MCDECRLQTCRLALELAKLELLLAKLALRIGIGIYSLRHRKCGVRGFIHELFVSKPERARYERVRAFDTNDE